MPPLAPYSHSRSTHPFGAGQPGREHTDSLRRLLVLLMVALTPLLLVAVLSVMEAKGLERQTHPARIRLAPGKFDMRVLPQL